MALHRLCARQTALLPEEPCLSGCVTAKLREASRSSDCRDCEKNFCTVQTPSDCSCLFSATPEVKKDVADATKDVNVEGTKDAFSAKTQALSSEASKESKVSSISMSACQGCECRGKKGWFSAMMQAVSHEASRNEKARRVIAILEIIGCACSGYTKCLFCADSGVLDLMSMMASILPRSTC